MANRTPVHATAMKTCVFLHLLVFLAESAKEGSLYMWIDSNQARTLIGFEEDILIVSEGKMAPFTHDFRKAQQRMPAIPVNIQHMNFTWQATGQAEYFYEFQALRSLDKDVMGDPTVNVPLLGMVSHKPSVVQIGFPCLGNQDGVASFEVTILVMDAEGNIILRTPHNAIFFKTCQRALCAPRCLNGGLCVSPGMCICPPGYYGINCDKGKHGSGICFVDDTCLVRVVFKGFLTRQSLYGLKWFDSHQTAPQSVTTVGPAFIRGSASALQGSRALTVKSCGEIMQKYFIVLSVKSCQDVNNEKKNDRQVPSALQKWREVHWEKQMQVS
ncbi:UNVERIFIED_CONTAM: hypothetical protein FKN15_045311 [Acipenser sinensis]